MVCRSVVAPLTLLLLSLPLLFFSFLFLEYPSSLEGEEGSFDSAGALLQCQRVAAAASNQQKKRIVFLQKRESHASAFPAPRECHKSCNFSRSFRKQYIRSPLSFLPSFYFSLHDVSFAVIVFSHIPSHHTWNRKQFRSPAPIPRLTGNACMYRRASSYILPTYRGGNCLRRRRKTGRRYFFTL